MTNRFDKIYCLDTNIILDDARNFITLSDEGNNLIVLPETVLDEIDSKKSGFDEINFQAREFGRLLYDATIDNKTTIEINDQTITVIETTVENTIIHIVSKEKYVADSDNTSSSIRNDRKILEITNQIKQDGYEHIKFISLDVMARTRAISLGIETEAMNLGTKEVELDFIKYLDLLEGQELVNGANILDYDADYQPNNFSYVFTECCTGRKHLVTIQNGNIVFLEESELRKQNVNPMNTEQLFFSNALLSAHYNIIVAEAKAGCSLPGSNIEIEPEEEWIYKDELANYIAISELPYIRKKGYIDFKKENNKTFIYNKNSIKYNLLKMLDSKDRPNDNRTLKMDENYDSKYCKLSYWLGFTELEYALKKVRSIRKYSKFFESPELENFTNYNPKKFKKIIADIQSQFIQIEKNINLLEDLYNYSNNITTLNYWFFRGWSEEEARYRIEDIQRNNGLKYGLKRKKNPEKYNDIQENQWKYWIKKGYTFEEAKLKVKERQTTFSLELCIEKYGVENGTNIFYERQRKWQETLDNKNKEEIDDINRRKMVNLCNASKASLLVFNKVIQELNLTNYYMGVEGNKEYYISDKTSKISFYDFTLPEEKIIIEFNGCHWHPKDGQTEWKSIHDDVLYEEALFKDKSKIKKATDHGFKVLVIWDDVSTEENIKKCIDFIKGNTNENRYK